MQGKLQGASKNNKAVFIGIFIALLAISWLVPTTSLQAQQTIATTHTDTLWSLARKHRPNNSVTIKQVMLAIQKANPHAFPSRNINDMEVGHRIKIPTLAAMRELSAAQADREVIRQNQAWVASSKAPAIPKAQAAAKPEQKSTPAKPATPKPAPAVQTPVSSQQKNATQAAQQIQQLEANLNSSLASIEALEQENSQLASELKSQQEQMITLERLVTLKDQQLTEMEEQLLAAGKAPVKSAPLPVIPVAEIDLASEIKRQPWLYGGLAFSSFLVIILFILLLAARKKLQAAQQKLKAAEKNQTQETDLDLNSDFALDASSKDFDLDIKAQPLTKLETSSLETTGLETDNLDTSFDNLGLDDLDAGDLELGELNADSLDINDLEPETLETVENSEEDSALNTDALLSEVDSLIAYGRLEQAAGLLQTGLEQEPEHEEMRLKLLEVLVALKDEETFLQQQQLLNSSAAKSQAQNLALAFAATTAANFEAEEPELENLNFDVDLSAELEELDADLDSIELDKPLAEHEFDEQNLATEFEPVSYESEADVFLDALGSLDDTDLEPLETVDIDNSELEPAPGVEKELAELSEDLSSLESLANELEAPTELETSPAKPALEPQINLDNLDDLADLDDFADLELDLSSFDADKEPAIKITDAPNDLSDLDDLSDLGSLNDLEKLDDLAELDDFADLDLSADLDLNTDLDLDAAPEISLELDTSDEWDLADLDDLGGAESGMSAQLDLASTYIEMGDTDGAKEVLQKVIAQADADTRATAEQMLASLD